MRFDNYQNDNQNTYINGLGFIPKTPKQLERKELIMRYNYLFISLIIIHLLRNVSVIPVIKLLAILGFDIRINPITKLIYKDDFSWQAVLVMVEIISMLIPILLLYSLMKSDFKDYKMIKTPHKYSMRYGIIIIIACSITCTIVSEGLGKFLENFGIILFESNRDFMIQNSFGAMILYIISLTLVPAILEELLFRGIIINGLRKFGDFIAILVSSVLYAFSQISVQGFIYSFFMGLVLGYFTLRAGSLIVPLLSNFIIRCMYIGFWLLDVYNIGNSNLIILLVIFTILVFSMISFCLFISKDKYAFCIYNKDTNLTNRDKLRYFISNIGFWVLCIIVLMECIEGIQIID